MTDAPVIRTSDTLTFHRSANLRSFPLRTHIFRYTPYIYLQIHSKYTSSHCMNQMHLREHACSIFYIQMHFLARTRSVSYIQMHHFARKWPMSCILMYYLALKGCIRSDHCISLQLFRRNLPHLLFSRTCHMVLLFCMDKLFCNNN